MTSCARAPGGATYLAVGAWVQPHSTVAAPSAKSVRPCKVRRRLFMPLTFCWCRRVTRRRMCWIGIAAANCRREACEARNPAQPGRVRRRPPVGRRDGGDCVGDLPSKTMDRLPMIDLRATPHEVAARHRRRLPRPRLLLRRRPRRRRGARPAPRGRSAAASSRCPKTTKAQLAMALGGRAWRGWFPLGGELTSGRPDWKEGLYFGTELADDASARARRHAAARPEPLPGDDCCRDFAQTCSPTWPR